jgi:hypothetical protein
MLEHIVYIGFFLNLNSRELNNVILNVKSRGMPSVYNSTSALLISMPIWPTEAGDLEFGRIY